jgi:hypothetical protein
MFSAEIPHQTASLKTLAVSLKQLINDRQRKQNRQNKK